MSNQNERAAGPSSRFVWSLAALVLLAALLRAYHLTVWDMWTDEVQTLWTAQTGHFIEGPMYLTAPVNFLLTMASVRLVGADELGLRIVPFIVGVATVGLLALVMRHWLGETAAVIAGLALALDPWHVAWSQTGRHFALQTLLVLLTVHFFLRAWVDGRHAHFWSSALFAALALLTHSSSMFYVLAIFAYIGVSWFAAGRWGFEPHPRRRYVTALLPFAIVLLLYLPLFFGVGRYLLDNKEAWNPPWNIVGSLEFYLPAYVVLTAMGGIFVVRREERDYWLLFGLVIGLPVVLVTVASAFTIASAAYCLATLPFIMALLGKLCAWLVDQNRKRMARAATIAVVLGLLLSRGSDLAHYYFVFNGLKPHWEEAVRYVDERRDASELFYAAEGDVAEFYLGRGEARWTDAAVLEAPLEPGSWYAVYTNGTIPNRRNAQYQSLIGRAELMQIFPAQYGAKNRSIAIFHARGVEP